MIDNSGRVALFHDVARRADELRFAIDSALMPQSPCEWVSRLAISLGCVASTEPGELQHYLLEHLADGLLWLEDLQREERAM